MTHWRNKFRVAWRGIGFAVTDQTSFYVHVPMAVVVLAIGAWLRIEAWQWVALVMAIAAVLVAELINSAIESLVRAVHPEHHPLVGRSLDTAAGAVLVASLAAIAIGLIVLGPGLYAVVSG